MDCYFHQEPDLQQKENICVKLSGDFKGKTFFMDDVKQETPSATRPSSFEVF